jgi:hypothetical protein
MHFLISATGTGPFGNLELFQVFLPHHVPGMSCMSGLLLSTATARDPQRASKKKKKGASEVQKKSSNSFATTNKQFLPNCNIIKAWPR